MSNSSPFTSGPCHSPSLLLCMCRPPLTHPSPSRQLHSMQTEPASMTHILGSVLREEPYFREWAHGTTTASWEPRRHRPRFSAAEGALVPGLPKTGMFNSSLRAEFPRILPINSLLLISKQNFQLIFLLEIFLVLHRTGGKSPKQLLVEDLPCVGPSDTPSLSFSPDIPTFQVHPSTRRSSNVPWRHAFLSG